jgi:hypothetical protein
MNEITRTFEGKLNVDKVVSFAKDSLDRIQKAKQIVIFITITDKEKQTEEERKRMISLLEAIAHEIERLVPNKAQRIECCFTSRLFGEPEYEVRIDALE